MGRVISDLTAGTLVYIDEFYNNKITKTPYVYLGLDESGNARVLRERLLSDAMYLHSSDALSYSGSSIDQMLENRTTGFLSRFNQATYNALVNTTIKFTDFSSGEIAISYVARKCFLMSYSELGYGNSEAGSEGKSYIDALTVFYQTSEANTARIAKTESDEAKIYWSRSARIIDNSRTQFYVVTNTGVWGATYANYAPFYCRPVLAFNPKTPVSEAGASEIELLPGYKSDTIELFGDMTAALMLFDRTLSEFIDHKITTIGRFAMYGMPLLSIVSCPNVTMISYTGFLGCSELLYADFPNLETVQNYAFSACYNLRSINAQNLSSIGSYAFNGCGALISAEFSKINVILDGAFGGCSMLNTASFLNATSICSYVFARCSKLQNINFPEVSKIGGGAFLKCYSLSTVVFSKAVYIGGQTFQECINLTAADFPIVSEIRGSAFASCSKLTNVIVGLSLSTVCTLANSNAFGGCTALSYIYVPSSLVESYKTATNWTYYSSIIYGV